MGRARRILIGIACGMGIGLGTGTGVAIGTYVILWHYSGMDKVTADDNPGVVLGAFWCIGWAAIAGVLAAVVTGLIVFLRSRRSVRNSN